MKFDLPEGATPIDPDDALGLIPNISTQGELNEFEAANIIVGESWARRSRYIKSNLLEQRTLRLLHKQMFGQTWKWAGEYRGTQKNLGCPAWQISTNMKNLEEDVKVWITTADFSPDEIAARFHHRLVWIHPFVNGNGRFARVATDFLCAQQMWSIPSWGSNRLVHQSETRTQYIQALRKADVNDFIPLQKFMYS